MTMEVRGIEEGVVGHHGERNGVVYSFQKAGDGPIITFRHGIGDDSTIFRNLVEFAYQQGSSTLTLDSPGHGYSKQGSVIREDPDNLSRILDECGIEKTHLVGYSMGATQALNFAHKAPDRTGKLLLLSPCFFDEEYLRLQPFALIPVYAALKKVWPTKNGDRTPKQTDFSKGHTDIYRAFLERVRATGIPNMLSALGELREVGVPDCLYDIPNETRIVAGKQDQLARKATTTLLKDQLLNSTTTWLESGHLILKEREKTIEAIINNFLCSYPT